MSARVLWLTKGLGLGGAERLLVLTAARLDRDRFEVDVAYLLPGKDAFVPDLERAGLRTICLGARRTVDPRWVHRLRRLLATGRYDLVHTHSPVPAVAARTFARTPTRLVHTEHNLWERYRWPTYAANAATYARNDAVLAVSDGVARSIHQPAWAPGSPPDVETLLHGVDADAISRGSAARERARTRLAVERDRMVIGCVANFTPKKDHLGLLEAMVELRAQHHDALLLLFGTGPLEEQLRLRTAELRLNGSVRFLGARDDVLELLPALDVFVLNSRFEGLPISLLEAMAAEVPCVTTGVGGIPEVVVDGQHGRLVDAGAPGRLAAVVADLLSDERERSRLAEGGRRRVLESFSIDRAVHRTQELYTQLLGLKPA
jgi:glycosyltransferase involved in cell wall biosynthesis